MEPQKIPRTIWVLGLVSLLMDTSSEIIHGLLPVFLVSGLGASFLMVGLIEGVGEGTVVLFKVISGPISDWLGKRKPLVLLGYSLSALSKPFFALAVNATWIFGARIFDRMGKGMRESPRDALIADITPKAIRGRAFGLRQSLDTVGAVIGPLLAIFLMSVFKNNYRSVFWISLIPAVLCLVLIVFGVREPSNLPVNRTSEATLETKSKNKISYAVLKKFKASFWIVAMAGAICQMAKFSEAFLILRAREVGLSLSFAPVVLIVMNIVYAISAYPLGKLSDSIGRSGLLFAGMVFLALADLILVLGSSLPYVFVGIACWGLHLGFTQSIFSALVADTCPEEYRGTAYGLFNIFSAVALFFASVMAGLLWDQFGSAVTFLTSGGLALSGLVILLLARKNLKMARSS